MVMDYRDGTLKDSSGNAFNGYMSDTAPYNPLNLFNGNFASNGTYSADPNSDAPPDPTHLPQWKVDPFAYPATTGCSASSHPAPATPPVGAVRYDSFGRCDVHYGNHILPLTLGNLEVGGVSWTANNFGIYNGNAFATDLAYGRAEDGVVPANFDAGKTDYTTTISRPIAFDSAFGGTYTIYFRYTDLNNWARLAGRRRLVRFGTDRATGRGRCGNCTGRMFGHQLRQYLAEHEHSDKRHDSHGQEGQYDDGDLHDQCRSHRHQGRL
jgi:hypothetical protein